MKSATALQSDPALNSGRLGTCFAALKTQKKCGFITFITAGDPDMGTCAKILGGLSKAGVDIIELGMPFSDPMADGPTIQAANLRAFKAGITISKVLDLVRVFRKKDSETPLVLMGYYNPLYRYGVDKFLQDAKEAGVDGLIIVDLPPEEDREMCVPTAQAGLNFIRLVTPTTDARRLTPVLNHASGFLYYVSITGTTGTRKPDPAPIKAALESLRKQTNLPVAVGFGISTPDDVRSIASFADAIVVGSAIVSRIAAHLDGKGEPQKGLVENILGFVESLAKVAHNG